VNAREQALRTRLREFEAPGEGDAGERGRRLLLAAFAERAPARRRRLRVPRIIWPVLAALLAACGVAVADHLRETSSPRAARASFAPVRVETGVVLALGKGVAYAVNARGRVRALGPASDGDLSPHGLNAVLASGSGLVAVDIADGEVRWRVPARGPVSFPRWSLERTVPPCCRVAYLVRGGLYVVGGDGLGAHRVARGALPVPPAWRPGGDEHELAFASNGGVRLLAADSGRVLATLPSPRRPLELSWRPDGEALAAVDASGVTLYSARGLRLGRLAVHGGQVLYGAYDPAGNRLVVLRRDTGGGSSLLVRGARGPLRVVRRLGVTAIGDLRLSPDGESALIASREDDEWIDIRLRDGHLQLLRNVGERLRAGFAPRALAWAG
jgi:hypothetical protein